jgi:transcriptional regulator with XRE-family HTH domain
MEDPVGIDALKTRVRQRREELGLSLRAAADQSDVPFNTLARVEKGDLPDLANFRRIVEWLGLPPEMFFQPPRLRTENTPRSSPTTSAATPTSPTRPPATSPA